MRSRALHLDHLAALSSLAHAGMLKLHSCAKPGAVIARGRDARQPTGCSVNTGARGNFVDCLGSSLSPIGPWPLHERPA